MTRSANSPFGDCSPLTQNWFAESMATTVWSCVSGLTSVLPASGRVTATPLCNSGATSIMMMRSTSMTSTSGVTLISALSPPDLPTFIDMVELPVQMADAVSYAVFLMK